MGTHSSTFGILNARDYLSRLIQPQYEEFKANNASQRHALLAIILVYHMYEWAHPEAGPRFCKESFETRYPGDPGMADRFDLARRICNGTKHFTPRAQVKTIVQAGFSSDFSYDFARPLNVVYDDGRTESVDEFLEEMMEFWKRARDNGVF